LHKKEEIEAELNEKNEVKVRQEKKKVEERLKAEAEFEIKQS